MPHEQKDNRQDSEEMDILLVDDHVSTREAICSLIDDQEDMQVVAQADSGAEGVLAARRLEPDLIVMDIVMPGMNGVEATRAIRSSNRDARILTLSNHTGHHLVEAVLEAGASGYVRKDQAYEELIPAIRAVASGRQYIGAHVDD